MRKLIAGVALALLPVAAQAGPLQWTPVPAPAPIDFGAPMRQFQASQALQAMQQQAQAQQQQAFAMQQQAYLQRQQLEVQRRQLELDLERQRQQLEAMRQQYSAQQQMLQSGSPQQIQAQVPQPSRAPTSAFAAPGTSLNEVVSETDAGDDMKLCRYSNGQVRVVMTWAHC